MSFALLPHQLQAVSKITPRKSFMLADAPGIGKSAAAIAIGRSKQIHPGQQSVVAPRNVLSQWRDTATDLYGETYSKAIHYVNYEQVHKPTHMARLQASRYLVLDESHYLKNIESGRFKLVATVCQSNPDRHILALSGTPIFSYPLDLFAQLYCLRLIGFEDFVPFRTRYCGPKAIRTKRGIRMTYNGCTNPEELKAKFAPYILRRDWNDVGLSMPPLTMTNLEVENTSLTGHPEYHKAAADFDAWYKETTGRDSSGLERFTVLRRMLAVAKIPAVLEQLASELKNDLKVLIFSEFREVAQVLAAQAAELVPGAAFLVQGGQTEGQRAAAFEGFKAAPGKAVLCATTDSLNVGVNLQAATRIYFVDVGFKPASFVQAVHRSWRLGQMKPVSVLRFVVEDSMDTVVTKNILTKESFMTALGLGATVSLGSKG